MARLDMNSSLRQNFVLYDTVERRGYLRTFFITSAIGIPTDLDANGTLMDAGDGPFGLGLQITAAT